MKLKKYNLNTLLAVYILADGTRTFGEVFANVYPGLDHDKDMTYEDHMYVAGVLTALNKASQEVDFASYRAHLINKGNTMHDSSITSIGNNATTDELRTLYHSGFYTKKESSK